MDVRQIAHMSGGLGVWGRYEASHHVNVTAIGPSAVDSSALGMVGGAGWVRFGWTPDLRSFELESDVRLSANGDLGVVERDTDDGRLARILLDSYLLGDARLSVLAGERLEELAHAL